MIQAVVVFVNYGPYHRARARALARLGDLHVRFVQLAAMERKYPWHLTNEADGLGLFTLTQGPYEDVSKLRVARVLWRVLDDWRPDVVITCGYNEPPMAAGALWTRLHGRGSVLMFDTTEWDRPRPWYQERPKAWYLRCFVDGVFCGGTAHREYLRKLGVPAARTWDKYDVVDGAYFAGAAVRVLAAREDARSSRRLPADYFLFVGRFSAEKNLPRLLHAYRRYRERCPTGWNLVLVGQGPDEQRLRATAAALGLTDIAWLGRMGAEQLPALYALAGAVVLPSVVEPWGLVVNEAMACGAPVLVSRRCGCALDLVSEGRNGYTFDPYDVGALAQRMEELAGLDTSTREAMRAASRTIVADFTPEVWAANLADCIRAVTGARRDT